MIRRYERLGLTGAWIAALLTPLVSAALMIPLRPHTQPSNLALVMVAVVAASSVPGYVLPAVASGLSAGAWFDFFLTRPYERFAISSGSVVQTALLMTAVATIVGAISARRRQAGEKARRTGEEVVGLYVTAQMLSAGSRVDLVLATVADQLTEVLSLSQCAFDSGPAPESGPTLDRAGGLDWEGQPWSPTSHGWPPVPVSLPVDSAGRAVGRFLLHGRTPAEPVTLDRLMTALALADLAGAALGRAGFTQVGVWN
jgi:hypothetical protein